VPFQYFGVADGTDLRELTWRRGSYATEELSNVFSNDTLRVSKLLEAITQIVLDPGSMRALGFCVSQEHAHFMARQFTDAGLPSVALTGEDSAEARRKGLADLQAGRLRCVFSVEIFGEGVDVPDVDCILLLRPTASATLFTQQLGRGLRRAEGKSHLTVIDLIGQQHRQFRFEDKLRAIVDPRRGRIVEQVAADFPFLPAGCTVDLDRRSEEIVLENLRAAVRSRWTRLVEDLKAEPDDTRLSEFLQHRGHRVEDVYGQQRSWTQIKRAAGHTTAPAADADFEARTLKALSRLTHVDDPERVVLYREILATPAAPRMNAGDERRRRLLTMLAWGLNSAASGYESVDEYFSALWAEKAILAELIELLDVLDARSTTRAMPSLLAPEIPLNLHARYSRPEVLAALAHGKGVKPTTSREGVLWVEDAKCDVFFVDLQKAERDYSPTTMYRDYAINRELFHWESQSRQSPHQPTVQRYINHAAEGTNVLLFVRQRKTFELGTAPFTFLGPATYVEHRGERPVAFTWRLPSPMPEELFEIARSVAAA
jgi:hypothetical protein